MRIAKTISITLPPDMLVQAQETAQREHRTMSELMREALRHYMKAEPSRSLHIQALKKVMESSQAHARSLGITTQEDVDRLIEEYRQEKRA